MIEAAMARGELFVTITAEWRWEDGDGTPCFVCGDKSYLRQRQLVVQADNHEPQQTGHVLCGSCGEMIDDDGKLVGAD